MDEQFLKFVDAVLDDDAGISVEAYWILFNLPRTQELQEILDATDEMDDRPGRIAFRRQHKEGDSNAKA